MTCHKCEKPIRSKGLCATHYMAHYRSQQPKTPNPRIIKLAASIRRSERKRIIQELEILPIHLVRWEVIRYLEERKIGN